MMRKFLRYDVTNLGYAIPDLKTGAVIGVGGGRDVLSQRLFGLSDVTGVEINPIIIDLLKRRFSDYTASIAALEGVKFEVDEARSWFARTPRSFDVIQMSLIDTWAATGAGAFTLTENGLYTVEAWERFLDRLLERSQAPQQIRPCCSRSVTCRSASRCAAFFSRSGAPCA
jgi:spermidine synthase